MAEDHDFSGYRNELRAFLATLERRLLPPATFDNDASLWCAAFVIRSQRLLLNGLHLVERAGPDVGVGVLARSAYESVIVGAWLLGDRGRLSQLQGELTRRHGIAVRGLWPDGDPPTGVAAILDHHRERHPPSRIPSVERIVDDVATWVSESEPVLMYRLARDGDRLRKEPLKHDGESYRSSYLALYRTLSTYEVHGAGTVQGWVDLDAHALRTDTGQRSVPDPTEVLVLVGAIVADVASRLLGNRPLRPEAIDRTNEIHLEWEARTSGLRAAARAVAADDPGEWAEFVALFE